MIPEFAVPSQNVRLVYRRFVVRRITLQEEGPLVPKSNEYCRE
jgi:hypothetical protein